MPSDIEAEYDAIERLRVDVTAFLGEHPNHRALAAACWFLRKQIEVAIKYAAVEPHPSIGELHAALGKFSDSVISRGMRSR